MSRPYNVLLIYQHDYGCVPHALLKLFLEPRETQRRSERFEAVQQAEAWYR